jgi:hypothetical protein
MTQRDRGQFTLSTRIFLTEARRQRLQHLVMREGVDLPELLSDLLADYLDELPEVEPEPEPKPDYSEEIRQRRMELRRVRAQQRAAGEKAPAWLTSYISELETEIARLESLAAS